MQILEALRARMSARRENNAEALVAAARRIATGETVDVATIESALTAEGRSPDDFEAMIELARNRQTWHAARDRGPAAANQRDKLKSDYDAASEAFEKTRLAWFEKSERLSAQIAAATEIVNAADAATEKLTHPNNVPGIHAERVRAAISEHMEASEQVENIRQEIKEAKARVRSEEEWCSQKRQTNDNRGSSLEEHERALKRAQRQLAELEAALPEAETAFTAAVKTLQESKATALKM
jgi:chromosome segregation ATPase